MQVHSIQTKARTPLDKRIAYALTDRKILHFRFDAHLRAEVWKRLSATQRQLLNRISAAGIEALPKRQLDKLLKELKAEIAKNYQEITAYIQPELSGFFELEKQAVAKLYNKEVGFDFFNQVPNYAKTATQQAVIVAGMPMGDWVARQGADLAFRFESTIRQGLLDGKQTHELVNETKAIFDTGRRNAETLVITAVAKVADDAHKALRDENQDIIKGEKHLATLDTRTSEICRLRDGLMWDLEQKPIGHNVPYQRPPLHPRCRSILQLVMKSWEELGIKADEISESTRASADGQVSEKTTYEDWLKSKTPEQQDDILGKGKADLWRRGVITFADMLDQRGRPLTLVALRELAYNAAKQAKVAESWLGAEVYQGLKGEITRSSNMMKSVADFNLTLPEAVAIRAYSSSHYAELNQALRNHSVNSAQQNAVDLLNKALDKMPAYEGKVYRRLPLSDENLFTVGKIFTDSAFLSTSKKPRLNEYKKRKLVIEIYSKSGKVVEKISRFPEEQEVLFGTRKKIRILHKMQGKQGEIIIKAEEL